MLTGTWLISRGRVIKELGLRRTDLVISTKIFWGLRKGPNDGGLSRKQYVGANFRKSLSVLYREICFSIIEGTRESLARLGLDYVDIIFAHRHDHSGMCLPTNKSDFYFLMSLSMIYSPDGGNRARLQLCYRKGLGKALSLILDDNKAC